MNILMADEASRVVMVEPADERLADVLPQVDAAIQEATGWDWTSDNPINPVAKRAARLRLAVDYDLGAMQPSQIAVLERAYISSISQLEAIAIGIKAIQDVNSAIYEEDMQTYLESGALGLNLINYNRLIHAGKYNVAKTMLDGRPSDGYPDLTTIQVAFDNAVKAVLPQ